MPIQRFYASNDTFTWPDGAIGHRTGAGPFDCLGPYAKVRNCRIEGTDRRVTAYATGYADTAFSTPAACKVRGRYVGGFFAKANEIGDDSITFHVYDRFKDRL